jgi:hypothetical protein
LGGSIDGKCIGESEKGLKVWEGLDVLGSSEGTANTESTGFEASKEGSSWKGFRCVGRGRGSGKVRHGEGFRKRLGIRGLICGLTRSMSVS